MRGSVMGNVWIIDSKEFALSWTTNTPTITDCLKQLLNTDQGYAISFVRRSPRSDTAVSSTLGCITLSSNRCRQLFHHAIQAPCERTNILAISLHAALRTDPTLVMRSLLARQDLVASHLGNGFVQVRPCVPVPMSSIQLLPSNGSCFNFPYISSSLPSGSRWHAFLNPTTGEGRPHQLCYSFAVLFIRFHLLTVNFLQYLQRMSRLFLRFLNLHLYLLLCD
ncbi:unnamed protein product [Nippostrongylus brasiliensis]|uniref:Uncharacterized protein n=1 Tax=Nippostrongylus brasiliensis TaxID=27835 RepID=A0A0N4XHK6_NIPBR|nr:unnamed protein product [Nippostrongylus brasiliensis]